MTWISIIAQEYLSFLFEIRDQLQVQASSVDEEVWLRVEHDSLQPPGILLKIPSRGLFRIDDEGRMFPVQGLTPTARISDVKWMSLPQVLPLEIPVSTMPGRQPQPVPLRLRQDENAQPSSGMLVDLDVLKQYVDFAPESRISTWKCALSSTNEVLILGTVLPTCPGESLWTTNQFLIPAGYNFEFPGTTDLIAQKWDRDQGSMILFRRDSSWEEIRKRDFIPASRATIRKLKGGVAID